MQAEEKANTGPKTPEGKRRSSLNALKHGLTAVSPQAQEKMALELQSNFEQVNARMLEYYQPQDNLEKELVRRISECLSKLDWCRQNEKQLLSRNPEAVRPNTSLQMLQKYERTADLQLHRTIAAINRKRETERKKQLETRREQRREKAQTSAESSGCLVGGRLLSAYPDLNERYL